MARVAVALSCTADVVAELERLSRSRSGEVRLAERARIVLACLQGKRNDEVAHEFGVRPNTVGQWRQRFAARGIAGLRDRPRAGKPVKYGVAAHPNVTFHFTPTSASWLNQVEIWFGIFQRKTLRNASFRSIDQLVEAIRDFTAAYNENAAPSHGASARSRARSYETLS